MIPIAPMAGEYRRGAGVSKIERKSRWIADGAHDHARREQLVQSMATTASLDDEEEELIKAGRSIFDVFATEGEARRTRARPLKQMPTIDRLRLKRDIKTGRLVGEGQALIRAPPEHILAYLSDTTGKHFQSRLNRNIYVRYETREVKNDHHAVLLIEMKTEPFRNRLLLVSVIWKKLSDDPRRMCGS